MRSRCQNPNSTGFARYGGRGIKVCQNWSSFEQFYADVGSRPSGAHTLDRIDNDGDYEPGNVRWALAHEQADNKPEIVTVQIGGVTKKLTEWAREAGLTPRVLRRRIQKKYPETEWLKPSKQFARKRPATCFAKIMLTKDGKTQPLVRWAEELGISRVTLYDRRKAGFTDEEMLVNTRLSRRDYDRLSRDRMLP